MKAKFTLLSIILCSSMFMLELSGMGTNQFLSSMQNKKSDTVNYTLSLYDDYGDGWEGDISLSVNGNVIISGLTLNSGSGPLDSCFSITNNDIISTIYSDNGGNYTSEEYYEIKDQYGNIILKEGENGSVPGSISSYKVKFPDSADVAPTAIALSEYNLNLSDSTEIIIEIKNNGLNAQNSIPLKISLDSGITYYNDTITNSINASQVVNHTFTGAFDLSLDTNYHLILITDLTNDMNKDNDTLFKTISNMSLPYHQNFDNNSAWPPEIQIYNNSTSGNVCCTQSSYYSAPNSLCLNNVSNDNGGELMFILPILHGNLSGKWLSFKYYAENTTDSIIVGVMNNSNNAGTFIGIDTIIASSNGNWISHNTIFPGYLNPDLQIAVKHTSQDAFSPIYIDDIYLSNAPSSPIFDTEPDTLSFNSVVMNFPDNDTKNLKIYNKGSGILNITGVNLTGMHSSNYTLSDTNSYPKALGPFEYFTLDITFTGSITGIKPASIDIQENSTHHFIPLNGTVIDAMIDTFTWLGSFDNNTNLTKGWRYNDEGFMWSVNHDSTQTINTGPKKDCKSDSGFYAYTEADNGNYGDEAYLISPPLDLSGLSNPQLKFWYHMYGADINKMYVDAAISGSWQVIDSLSGEKQQSENAEWLLHTTSLINYSNTDSIRFRVIRGPGCFGDVAIDNVALGENLYLDLGQDTAICEGSQLTMNPGNYYRYYWYKNTLNNLIDSTKNLQVDSSGIYILKVVDEGEFYACDSINILVHPNPDDVIISGPVTMDYNGTASFTAEAGLGTLFYDWYNGDTTKTVTLDYNDVNPGHDTISVVVTNNFGCAKSQWKHIYVINPSGIKLMDELQNIEVFPNPSSEYLNIEFNTARENLKITIIDQHGKIVQKNAYKGGVKTKTINVSHLPSGVYYLSISSGKEQAIRKVVVE